jgi:hypothetical protein
MTFIDACLKGETKPADIHDWVQRWHDTADTDHSMAIWDYLGMTGYEYGRWCENPKLLDTIMASRVQEEVDGQMQALGYVILEKKQKLSRLKNQFQNLEVEIRDLEKMVMCLEQALDKI